MFLTVSPTAPTAPLPLAVDRDREDLDAEGAREDDDLEFEEPRRDFAAVRRPFEPVCRDFVLLVLAPFLDLLFERLEGRPRVLAFACAMTLLRFFPGGLRLPVAGGWKRR